MYHPSTKQQQQQQQENNSSSDDGKDYFDGCSCSSSSSTITLAKTAQRQTHRSFIVTSILTQINNIDSDPPPPPPPHGKIRFDTTVGMLDDVIDILPPCSDDDKIDDDEHNDDDDSSTSISNLSNDEEFCVPIISEPSSENRISFYKTSQEQKREFLLDNTESFQKMLAKSRDGILEDLKTPSLVSTSHYDDEDDEEEEEDDSWLLSY